MTWCYEHTLPHCFWLKFSRQWVAGGRWSELESERTCLSCLPVCICFVALPLLRRRFKQSSGLANSNQKHSPWGGTNLQSKSTHSHSFITTWDIGFGCERARACLCWDKNEVNAFLQIFQWTHPHSWFCHEIPLLGTIYKVEERREEDVEGERTSAGWHIGRYGVCAKLNNLGTGMRGREKGREGGGKEERGKKERCVHWDHYKAFSHIRLSW